MHSKQKTAFERQIINDAIRAFFRSHGYLEVETPILVRSPDMAPNLTPFETIVREPNGREHRGALITSPEFSMKKLLGLGLEKIFTITKVFRNEEEFGATHNPEFSMIEWYQQGADYFACMDETQALIGEVARALNVPFSSELFARKRIRDLFLSAFALDLDSATENDFRAACAKQEIHVSQEDTQSDLFYRLFLSKIEPHLKNIFVYDYPHYQAALSQLTPDGNYGQRFELYLNGLEICNGFTELTDSIEQRARFEQEAQERVQLNKTVFPIDETFLRLLGNIKNPTCGNALGIDRLHMVLTGKKNIEDVLLFPAKEIFQLEEDIVLMHIAEKRDGKKTKYLSHKVVWK